MRPQTNYPLTIIITTQTEINIHFSYNSDLLPDYYMQEIKDHFEQVLRWIAGCTGSDRMIDVELLTPKERIRLLKKINTSQAAFPVGDTVVSLFGEQVKKNPLAPAVVFD